MRIDEPLRAGVVEVRQRALPERLRCVLVAGDRPLTRPYRTEYAFKMRYVA